MCSTDTLTCRSVGPAARCRWPWTLTAPAGTFVNVRGRDALLVQSDTEDRGGSHVPAHGARRVPARHQYVDDVVDPATQRPGPDLVAMRGRTESVSKAWSPPWPPDTGNPQRPRVLCQAHGSADARHAGGNGARLTVTCHNARWSYWAHPDVAGRFRMSGASPLVE